MHSSFTCNDSPSLGKISAYDSISYLTKQMVEYLINPENATPDKQPEYFESLKVKVDLLEHIKAMQALKDKHLAALDTYRGCGEVPPT